MLAAPCSSGKLQSNAYQEGMGQKPLNLAGRVVAVASCTLGLAGMGNSVLPGRMTRFQHNPVRRDQSEKILANEIPNLHSATAVKMCRIIGCRIQTCTRLQVPMDHSKPARSFGCRIRNVQAHCRIQNVKKD